VHAAAALVVATALVSTASVAPGAPEQTAARPVPPRVQTLALTDDGAKVGVQSTSDGAGIGVQSARDGGLTGARLRTRPFSLLGVTWSGGGSGDYDVAVRAHTGGAWTEWARLEVADDGPGIRERETRAGTAPYWAGRSDGVQVRVVPRHGELPGDLAVALIDPGRSAGDRALAAPPAIDAESPLIHSRRQWGADESLRTDGPRFSTTIKAGFVHHTAGANGYTKAQVPSIIRGIYAYHVKSRGWSDIGYQFLVDKFGRLWEGRYGGVHKAVRGAHAGGFNTDTFGVSALGTFTNVTAPVAMQYAIADLMAWKLSLYGRDPEGKTVLVSEGGGTSRHPKGRKVTVDVISGHRDVGNTACPGKRLYATLPQIRAQATARLEEDAP